MVKNGIIILYCTRDLSTETRTRYSLVYALEAVFIFLRRAWRLAGWDSLLLNLVSAV